MPEPSTVLVVTYTLANPSTVGVFFRALRLGFELAERGHRVVVLNAGPVPEDPKVEAARGRLELAELPWADDGFGIVQARRLMRSFSPDVVVFGEGPFGTLQTHFRAARGLWAPFVLLDQYYQDWLLRRRPDLDRILLYGLPPLLEDDDFDFGPRYRLVPPFIGEVAPPERLPIPPELLGQPAVALLAFEPTVLEGAAAALAGLPAPGPVVLATSHDPPATRARLAAAGLSPERIVSLGLLADADLFGLMAASRAVILANGYMQILEALALGRPALAILRGVGLEAWTVPDHFRERWVSIGEEVEVQRRRLAAWLAAPALERPLVRRLGRERHGARRVADEIEALLARRHRLPERWRRLRRVARSYLSRRE